MLFLLKSNPDNPNKLAEKTSVRKLSQPTPTRDLIQTQPSGSFGPDFTLSLEDKKAADAQKNAQQNAEKESPAAKRWDHVMEKYYRDHKKLLLKQHYHSVEVSFICRSKIAGKTHTHTID